MDGDARDEARLKERADVVAHMRQQDQDDYWKPEWVARAIAAGKHVGASDAQNGIGPGSSDRA